MGEIEITIEREIKAPPAKIYNSLTDPQILSSWFTTNARGDLRVGGRYSNDDKDRGSYLDLRPFEKVRFTWDNPEHCPGTEVDIDIVSLSYDITMVRLAHSKLETEEGADEMKEGWSWALDSLKSFLEKRKPITFEQWKKRKSK